MSCYWDTLIKNIKKKDIDIILKLQNIQPTTFAKALKEKNKLVNTITCNDDKITEQQQKENFEHIKDYDIKTVSNGYCCSTCDPFLILISDIFSITIINNYNNNIIIYKPVAVSRYIININNDKGHMW